MTDKYEILKHYFGHDAFRDGQEKLIDGILAGRDVLGIMPTGSGKSVCYQVPSMLIPGVTLVISPLISLMKDQVAALKAAGIPGAFLNSSLTPAQIELALQRAANGEYKIIYIAPERLETASFQRFARNAVIAMIAVDEAHCVSQWGQDFRPSYLKIADFIAGLPHRPPVGAYTATATPRVRTDITRLLALRDPLAVTTGFDRPNLYFEVQKPKDRFAALSRILDTRRDECGIVYCATRKNVDEVCEKLQADGYAAGRYHAGLSEEVRTRSQEDFQNDRIRVMVATNAFGMGIDKSNVRYVIHYNMPRSMEAYYQEAGRAGRDGLPSDCILLYHGQDVVLAKWMIENSSENEELSDVEREIVRAQDETRLRRMIDYCFTGRCLRAFMLNYFGQPAETRCEHCSACLGARYGDRPVPLVSPRPGAAPDVPEELLSRLKACRLELARQYHVPAYIICDDRTLTDMARKLPRSKLSMLAVQGMGSVKVNRYGDTFLPVILDWIGSH